MLILTARSNPTSLMPRSKLPFQYCRRPSLGQILPGYIMEVPAPDLGRPASALRRASGYALAFERSSPRLFSICASFRPHQPVLAASPMGEEDRRDRPHPEATHMHATISPPWQPAIVYFRDSFTLLAVFNNIRMWKAPYSELWTLGGSLCASCTCEAQQKEQRASLIERSVSA